MPDPQPDRLSQILTGCGQRSKPGQAGNNTINGDTMIKLSNLTPHPDNPRKITDAQMDKLKDSIRRDPEYMQPRPLVVNKDNIILAGNQRWKALRALGHDEIPEDWVRFVDWDKEKSRRFVIMDNHQSGEWDEEILLARWMDVDLEGLGVPFDVEVESEIPDENKAIDEQAFSETQHECPKCGFKW